jgi:hypothetical protein
MTTLEEIYAKMTTRFSSNRFGNIAKKHKVLSEHEITNGAIAGYLRGKKCKRISNRTWEKPSDHTLDAFNYSVAPIKADIKEDLFSTPSVSDFLSQLPIENLINHIKSKGFIVLKP